MLVGEGSVLAVGFGHAKGPALLRVSWILLNEWKRGSRSDMVVGLVCIWWIEYSKKLG